MPSEAREQLDLSPEALVHLLKNFSNHPLIGELALAQTPVVERIRTQMNLKDSAASKGLVLAMILRDIVVSQQERTKDTEESTIWDFIALRFFGERSAANVAYELEVGERSLPRIQKRALGHFAAALPPIFIEKSSDYE